jgi:hypothetical protein
MLAFRQEKTPALATEGINEKTVSINERLKELRNARNPHESIPF